jgi:hypothetical protein
VLSCNADPRPASFDLYGLGVVTDLLVGVVMFAAVFLSNCGVNGDP